MAKKKEKKAFCTNNHLWLLQILPPEDQRAVSKLQVPVLTYREANYIAATWLIRKITDSSLETFWLHSHKSRSDRKP